MKGSLSLLVPIPVLLALESCATTARPPAMPAWAPEESALVAAAAPRDFDDDEMRVPSDEETPDIWPAQGLYVGGMVITGQPLGDFGDDISLAGPTDLVLVPDLDVGAGVGGYVAYRWHMNELMVQYSFTEHDGEFSGSPREHDTKLIYWDFNWRHYFWERSPLQPYGLLGLGKSRAEIDNGSTDQATGTVFEDASFEDGITVNVGAGLALYPLPWVAGFGQAVYRFGRFKSSDGIDGEFSNDPDIDADAWELSFGAAIRLLPGRHRNRH
jgi:hypothetical protein